MATVSYRLEDLKKAIVGIGYVGENDHMHVLIDCKEVFDEYPDAVPTMAIVPPVGEGYPKAVTRNGDVVEWLVKDSDVTVEGDGEFQLSFTEGEIIRKSVNARFRVKRSISGSGSAPSGVQDWLTDANEKLAEVEQATQDAEAAASHQPYIGIDGYWYTWNGTEFVKNVKAQGEKGDPGDPGTPGDPTQLIDDTQKSANKTYSSNKVDEELTSVKTDITKDETDIEDIKDVLDIEPPGTVNLFDVNNPNTTNLVPKTDGSGQITTSNGVYSVLLQVEPNSTVTLIKTDGNRCQILSFNSSPAKNDYWVQNVISPGGNTGLTVTITTGATDVYLLCYLATSTSSCNYNTLKIFYGTEWHDSTPNKIEVLDAKLFNMLPDANCFNLVSKRYLGQLTKPYIAISCDDGASDLATTTIPLFKGYKTTYGHNIPITMGLMSTSYVLGVPAQTALVNEMLTDYGCEVATHGANSYTSYTNKGLKDFLAEQETFINSKCGRKPVGIIYPNHAYDTEKSVIAGSFYGVCAGGYSNGVKYQQCNGARSNMYELHRWSLFVASQTENTIKTVVDYAYDNNLLLMPWFHDNALTGDDGAANIALLDYLVSYAESKGIDFISFKDIPTII